MCFAAISFESMHKQLLKSPGGNVSIENKVADLGNTKAIATNI